MRDDRLGLLQLTRAVIAAVAIAAVSAVDSLPSPGGNPAATLVAWVLITFAAEATRRMAHLRGVAAPLAVLVLDGFVLAFVTADTGGYRSPLLGLVYLHVVAVSLLVSHRVALRIAVWHGLLLFGAFAAAASHAFGLRLHEPTSIAGAQAALHACGFLLVAIGVAACAALNEQVVRRTHRELSTIARAGSALTGTLDVDTAVLRAADTLRDALGVRRVAVAFADGRSWRGAASTEQTTMVVAGGAELPRVDEPSQVRTLDPGPFDDLLPCAANVVVAPFTAGDDRGVVLVEIGGGARTQVPASTIVTVSHVAALVGTTLENAQLHARVEELATRDGLTGLANRRVFDAALADDVRRAQRTDEPFSLVILDVDHFKSVNDVHGHQAGDDVLRAVAAALSGAVRETDLAARYGGEELVVLLRGCGAGHALAIADELRRAAGRHDGPVPVTLSAGVASHPEHAVDAASLVAAADAALYQAKHGGRDQTRVAQRRRLSLVERRSA